MRACLLYSRRECFWFRESGAPAFVTGAAVGPAMYVGGRGPGFVLDVR